VSGVLIKYKTVANGIQIGETNNKGTVIFKKDNLIDLQNDRINVEIEYFIDGMKFYKTTSINQKSSYFIYKSASWNYRDKIVRIFYRERVDKIHKRSRHEWIACI
jgi:hypothetical protein